jgi:hypothetical protein
MTWFWRKKESKSIQDLWEAIKTITREVERKDMDWADMRARCRRLLDRTEKAAARAEKAEPGVESEGSPQANGGDTVSAGRVLSAHQIEVQQSILRRRAGL